MVRNEASRTRSWFSQSAFWGNRQITRQRVRRTGWWCHRQAALVYCDCREQGAGLFFIKTQCLSVGLLQGLSDVLPVNTPKSDSIRVPYAGFSDLGSHRSPLAISTNCDKKNNLQKEVRNNHAVLWLVEEMTLGNGDSSPRNRPFQLSQFYLNKAQWEVMINLGL